MSTEVEPAQEKAGPPDLVLGPAPEGVFRAVDEAPQWAWMMMAVVAKKNDDIAKMEALVKLVNVCVVPEDRDRLTDYLIEHNEAVAKLEGALTVVGQFWSGRPLEQSSTSSPSSPLPESGPTLRVVSLSAGTSETVPLPAKGGRKKRAG
jgi:hypothetical protein